MDHINILKSYQWKKHVHGPSWEYLSLADDGHLYWSIGIRTSIYVNQTGIGTFHPICTKTIEPNIIIDKYVSCEKCRSKIEQRIEGEVRIVDF